MLLGHGEAATRQGHAAKTTATPIQTRLIADALMKLSRVAKRRLRPRKLAHREGGPAQVGPGVRAAIAVSKAFKDLQTALVALLRLHHGAPRLGDAAEIKIAVGDALLIAYA